MSPKPLDVRRTVSVLVSVERSLARASVTSWQSSARYPDKDRQTTYVAWRGGSFQTRATATGKARSPTMDNRVRQTISDNNNAANKSQPPSPSMNILCCQAGLFRAQLYTNCAAQMDLGLCGCRIIFVQLHYWLCVKRRMIFNSKYSTNRSTSVYRSRLCSSSIPLKGPIIGETIRPITNVFGKLFSPKSKFRMLFY